LPASTFKDRIPAWVVSWANPAATRIKRQT